MSLKAAMQTGYERVKIGFSKYGYHNQTRRRYQCKKQLTLLALSSVLRAKIENYKNEPKKNTQT